MSSFPALLACALMLPACAAAACTPKAPPQTGSSGALKWTSYAGAAPTGSKCLAVDLENTGPSPLELEWRDAGILHAVVRDHLRVELCCFENTAPARSSLRFGNPLQRVNVTRMKAPENEEEEKREGFPDLIDHDARERTVSIQGTLGADSRPVRVNLQLQYSASKYAEQYAYQFKVSDSSEDPITVKWDPLDRLRTLIKPVTQQLSKGQADLFLSPAKPKPRENTIEIWTTSGQLAARFRLEGFAPAGVL